MKYIVFIDYNKDRMRSKEKRRSNKFYAEMARFISTRNALQCRSHHQKLEEKYVSAPKIIAVFKTAFDRRVYREEVERLSVLASSQSPPSSERHDYHAPIRTVEVEVQTEIKGVNLQFISTGPSTVMMVPPAMSSPPIGAQTYPMMPFPGGQPGGFGWWSGCFNQH